MPIQRCKVKGKLGWKWGQSGKCYLGPGAIAKARRQEAAIRASGWTENARLTRDTEPGVAGTTEEVRISNRGTQQPSTTDSDVGPIVVHNARSTNGSVTSSAPRTKVVPSNPLKADPTRTITLRRRFERALTRRFLELKTKLIGLVAREDAFALSPKNKLPDLATPLPTRFTENEYGSERGQAASVHSSGDVDNSSVEPIPMDGRLAANTRFRFHTDAEKVTLFQQWLAAQAQNGILQVTQSNPQDAYWAAYIEDAFKKGAGRAFDDTKAAARAIAWTPEEGAFYQGTKSQFLQSAFAHPVAIDKVKLLASRTFTDLQGVTDTMAVKMSRVLTDGLAQGQSPRVVARTLAKEVDVGITRARTIARTETIRAHAQGQLVALEQLGVKEIGVMVEWSSVDDDRRCPLCEALEGVVLKIKEANTLIPRHPNCRCAFIPANVGESTKGQKRGKTKIQQAIDESVRREIPKRSKRSLATQKKQSTWPGAGKTIDKSRLRSILERKTSEKRTVERCGGLTINAPGPCSIAKSEIAKSNAKRVGRDVQRYSEEHNEAQLAKSLGRGAKAIDDNAPHDVQWRDRGKTHGIELKTMVDNSNNKLTMKRSAMDRKAKWLRANRDRVFHTVVFNDGEAIPGNSIAEKAASLNKFLTKGCCIQSAKRRIFYRRGYGSFRVENMYEVKDIKELKKLLRSTAKELPEGAL